MWDALKSGIGAIGRMIGRAVQAIGTALLRMRIAFLMLALIGGLAWAVLRHPPIQTLARGEVGLRTNALTGTVTTFGDGSVLVIPHLHRLRVFGLRDRTYRAEAASRADGADAFQSVEGLSLGVNFSVRYALDPTKLSTIAAGLPDDIDGDVVAPAMQGIA
jgi:hypothetical protein